MNRELRWWLYPSGVAFTNISCLAYNNNRLLQFLHGDSSNSMNQYRNRHHNDDGQCLNIQHSLIPLHHETERIRYPEFRTYPHTTKKNRRDDDRPSSELAFNEEYLLNASSDEDELMITFDDDAFHEKRDVNELTHPTFVHEIFHREFMSIFMNMNLPIQRCPHTRTWK